MNRRKFLRRLGVGTGALILAPTIAVNIDTETAVGSAFEGSTVDGFLYDEMGVLFPQTYSEIVQQYGVGFDFMDFSHKYVKAKNET